MNLSLSLSPFSPSLSLSLLSFSLSVCLCISNPCLPTRTPTYTPTPTHRSSPSPRRCCRRHSRFLAWSLGSDDIFSLPLPSAEQSRKTALLLAFATVPRPRPRPSPSPSPRAKARARGERRRRGGETTPSVFIPRPSLVGVAVCRPRDHLHIKSSGESEVPLVLPSPPSWTIDERGAAEASFSRSRRGNVHHRGTGMVGAEIWIHWIHAQPVTRGGLGLPPRSGKHAVEADM